MAKNEAFGIVTPTACAQIKVIPQLLGEQGKSTGRVVKQGR
jgi:hypothetical protein